MPVYKGDKYLSEAVESILNQTFHDFEFIIICDEPTESTRIILDKFRQNDSRVDIYYQEERQGLVNSRNRGISLAKGEYIANMDADDISLPDRLKKQVEFMDNNPDIGIAGTWLKTFGDRTHFFNYASDHETIISQMIFTCPIAQPSTILSKRFFCEKGLFYDRTETHAEDYGLWVRSASVLKLANIPQVYLYYRVHNSSTNKNVSKEISRRIRLSQIEKLGINPTPIEIEIHEALGDTRFEPSENFIYNAKSWLEKLQHANLKMKTYPEAAFSNVLANYWFYVCYNSEYSGIKSWNLFYNSNLSKPANLMSSQKAILLLKPVSTLSVLKKMKHFIVR